MPRRIYVETVRYFLGIAAASSFIALAVPANAADPSATRLTVPGDTGPSAASWQGPALSGHSDPGGPPASECVPGDCDQEQFVLQSRQPDYATTHVLTMTVWISYDA